MVEQSNALVRSKRESFIDLRCSVRQSLLSSLLLFIRFKSFSKIISIFLKSFIFAHIQNVRERVNALNFARDLESVYFDRSCKMGLLIFEILPMLIQYRIL